MSIFGKLFDKKPDHDAFAKLAAEAAIEAGFPAPTYDRVEFMLRYADKSFAGLGNVYRIYCDMPKAERAAFLKTWFVQLNDNVVPETFEAVKSSLLPMIRKRDEVIQFSMRPEMMSVQLDRAFSDELRVCLVVDKPTLVMLATRVDLARWGVSEDEAFAAAFHNLRLKSADAWQQVLPGVYASGWRDNFDATRALLPDLVRRAPIEGEPIILLPNRNHLLVASARDETAIELLVAAAKTLYEQDDYSLSMRPMTLSGDTWIPATLHGKVKNDTTRIVELARSEAYEQQARLFEQTEGEHFFSKLVVFRKGDDGPVLTVASWAPGVPTMLPKAESLAMAVGDQFFRVAWDDVERVVGPFRQEPDLWPPRFRADEYPSDSQLSTLKNMAL